MCASNSLLTILFKLNCVSPIAILNDLSVGLRDGTPEPPNLFFHISLVIAINITEIITEIDLEVYEQAKQRFNQK